MAQPKRVPSEKEVEAVLREAQIRAQRDLEESRKPHVPPKPLGKCRVCGGTLKERSVSEPFTMHTPIGSPLGVLQENYYCEDCGIMYAFDPGSKQNAG